jgi:hypothetical protein
MTRSGSDPRDWRLASTPAGLDALLRRMDVIVTTRLHGLVLGLRSGVPALAIDPVVGGAKVSAQARALQWPAAVTADADEAQFDRWLTWCLGGQGREAAARAAIGALASADAFRVRLLEALSPATQAAVPISAGAG